MKLLLSLGFMVLVGSPMAQATELDMVDQSFVNIHTILENPVVHNMLLGSEISSVSQNGAATPLGKYVYEVKVYFDGAKSTSCLRVEIDSHFVMNNTKVEAKVTRIGDPSTGRMTPCNPGSYDY